MDSKWSINITKTDNRITIQYSSDYADATETIMSNKPSIENHKFIMDKLEGILGFLYLGETASEDNDCNYVVTAQDNQTKELILMEVNELYEPGDTMQVWDEDQKELKDTTCVSYTAKISEEIYDYLTKNE